jgi:hypothetical protein
VRPFPIPDRDADAAREARTALAYRPPSRPSGATHRRRRPRRALRYAAAASIAVGGYVHYCLYRHGFRTIPKIGVGFLLQVITSALVAGALLIGHDRVLRLGRVVVRSSVAVWLVGLGLSVGTLTAFGLSHTPMGLFAFREFGWQPAPQAAIALVAETAAVVLLATGLLVDRRRPVPAPARVHRRRRLTLIGH